MFGEMLAMVIRLLFAVPDTRTRDLLQSLSNAALRLVPLQVEMNHAQSQDELVARTRMRRDDLVMLDWTLAEADTPKLVRELKCLHPWLHLIVLLPLQLQPYRQSIWEAGVCTSIPKESLEQEWLSSVLCMASRHLEWQAHRSDETLSERSRQSSQETRKKEGGAQTISQASVI